MEDPDGSRLQRWFTTSFHLDWFVGAAGGRVRYALQRRDDARGLAIIVSGRTEFIEKYLEVAEDLQESGYALCLYDHYGQGGSDRPLADRNKGHIDDFQIYVDDLFRLVDLVSSRCPAGRPLVLIGHSMGGTVAALALARDPHFADGLVLVAPMLQINTGPLLPTGVVAAISALVCRFGGAQRYVWGEGPLPADLPFAGNVLTGDATRFGRNRQLVAKDDRLSLGRPTFGWLHQAHRAMSTARRSAGRISCPVVLLIAGADTVVGLTAMHDFARRLQQVTIKHFDGARHELLMEQDSMRSEAIGAINSFLKDRAG